MDGDGKAIVVWQSREQDGSRFGRNGGDDVVPTSNPQRPFDAVPHRDKDRRFEV
jgi:hypothetical protein